MNSPAPPGPASDGPRPPTLDDVRHWPAVVAVEEAAAAFGISRSHAYELIKRNEFPAATITLGSSKRVLTESIITTLTTHRAPRSSTYDS